MAESREYNAPVRAVIIVIVGAVLVVAAVAVLLTGQPVGLRIRVLGGAGPDPLLAGVDPIPSTRSVEQWSGAAGVDDPTLIWDGFLHVPESRTWTIGVAAAGRARLHVGDALVLETPGSRAVNETAGRVVLDEGAHRISLELRPAGGPPQVQLRWDAPGAVHRLGPVPAEALSPRGIRPSQWSARRWRLSALSVLTAVWVAVLAWAAVAVVRRLVPGWDVLRDRAVRLALVGSLVLFVPGIGWGVPGPGWAPDEIDLGSVEHAVQQRFAGGWHDRYPPLGFAVWAGTSAPVLASAAAGYVDTLSASAQALFRLQARLVSVLFAVGTLAAVAVLCERLVGRRRAWLAVLAAAAFLPLVYYAKTANLEAMYLFWFALSAIAFVDVRRHQRVRDAVAFGVTAALAIATKDQAYGLYALPALYLLFVARRRLILSGAAAACGLLVLAAAHNLPLNWIGFVEHVREIAGPSSADFRTFDASVSGQAALAAHVISLVAWALGGAGLLAVALGAVRGWWDEAARAPWWLWLAPVSYYVSFLVVVGFAYDRFLLPATILLALPAAVGLEGCLSARRPVIRLLGVALLGLMLARAGSISALMVFDGRHDVEEWLRAEVPAGAVVAGVGPSEYLPRLGEYRQVRMRPYIADTEALAPEFIVVNINTTVRADAEAATLDWLAWLDSSAGPYREAMRYRTPFGWSPLRWDPRFANTVDDPATNLDKVNPLVVIYRRVR